MATDDEVLRVAQMFGAVARALAHQGLNGTLDRIASLAVDHLEHCEHAGFTMVEGGRVRSPGSSGGVSRHVDEIQDEVREGPCLDAIRDHHVFQTGNLTTDTRWPRFSKRAFDETGICSILSLRLFVEGETLGALNLYSTKVDAFNPVDVELGGVFAVHAAIAWSSSQREADLEKKASSRDVIGQAKGIIMARRGVIDPEAFALLRQMSQNENVKLVDIAARLVQDPDQYLG